MEEMEDHTEKVSEQVHEIAREMKVPWIMGVALSSAILAALAAISSLLAGHQANEAMLEQIRAADQWAYYQAKGIKAAVLDGKVELLAALGKPSANPNDPAKLAQYKKEQEAIRKEAEAKEEESSVHLKHHVVYSRAVTMFQVSIAVGAIAVLTQKRWFWGFSLFLGLLGLIALIHGLLL